VWEEVGSGWDSGACLFHAVISDAAQKIRIIIHATSRNASCCDVLIAVFLAKLHTDPLPLNAAYVKCIINC
jgi:hypothetical protein